MKYYPILLFALLSIIACSGSEKKDENGEVIPDKPLEERIADHIQKELESEERNDTIVLDFRFKMSRNDVYRHTKKLHSQKKMYPIQKTKKTREYVYDLRLRKAGKLRTFFEAYYYDKKELYRVECVPKIDTSKLKIKDVLQEIKPIYEAEYGKPHFIVPNEEDPKCKTYLWVDGNRKIELGCFEDQVFMYYEDIPLARKAAADSDL